MLKDNSLALKLLMEFVFLLITGIVIYVVLTPLLGKFVNQEYLIINAVYIFTAITLTRYIFLLKFTFLANVMPLKILLVFACIPLIFFTIEKLQNFQEFIDQKGLEGFDTYFSADLSFDEKMKVLGYFKQEFIFSGIAATTAAAIFPIRMIISIWRTYNKTGRV